MRYIAVLVKQKENIESLLCTENGVVLRKREGALLEPLFENLPKGRVAAYLGGVQILCPKSWRVKTETEKEALLRGCQLEEGGAVLRIDAETTLITKKVERSAKLGSTFVLGKAMQRAKSGTGYLRYALEVAVGLPIEEIDAYFKTLSEEKRLSYVRVVQKGCHEGDAASLEIAKEAIEGYLSLLADIHEEACPLYIEGPHGDDLAKIWESITLTFPGKFCMQKPLFPPMLYFAMSAAKLFRMETDEAFCHRFLSTY